jgi:hypothetical protein
MSPRAGKGVGALLWALVAVAIAMASVVALISLDPNRDIPSAIRNPLSEFVGPGVAVWWLVVAGPFRSVPSSPGGMAFAAAANTVLWLVVARFALAVVRAVWRRLDRSRTERSVGGGRS